MAWQRNASWRTEYSLFPWWLSCWRERAQGCPSPCIGSVLCQGLWQVPGQGMSQRTPSGNWQRMRQNLAVGVYEQDSKGFTLTWSLIWIWLVRFPLVLVCFLSNSKILNSLFSKISNSVAAAWLSCFFFFFFVLGRPWRPGTSWRRWWKRRDGVTRNCWTPRWTWCNGHSCKCFQV